MERKVARRMNKESLVKVIALRRRDKGLFKAANMEWPIQGGRNHWEMEGYGIWVVLWRPSTCRRRSGNAIFNLEVGDRERKWVRASDSG
jgi:hypothetical protein